ncbi:MAG: hypothetical protein JNJ59_13240 [Deltaproteobacteria bacterium]|nr:hypothetical protein [Deltaproteobacteria bacterium]
MSEPSLADVLVRLDRLESALLQLIEVVRSQPGALAPQAAAPAPVIQVAPAVVPVVPVAPVVRAPEATGVAAQGEPPVITVAAPLSPRPAQPPVGASGEAEPVRAYDPYGWRTDIEIPPPSATIHQVLVRVFEAALMPEPEDTWAVMTKLTHPSQMQGPRALDHFKAFNWHKLRRTGPGYLQNGDPKSFVIAYTDPAEITAEVDRVRVFIKSGDNRMPVPIGFARDPAQSHAWRVTAVSL